MGVFVKIPSSKGFLEFLNYFSIGKAVNQSYGLVDWVHMIWHTGSTKFIEWQPLKSRSMTEILKIEGVSDLRIWIIRDETNNGD
jgi:hypothetical protein